MCSKLRIWLCCLQNVRGLHVTYSVQFHVAQAQTRDLIEQAIPRLREMLAQEGLQLADSQVSQGGGGRDGQSQESSQGTSQQHDLDENSALEHSMFQNDSESLQSGIDYYA